MRWSGTAYRAHDPRWAWTPLSGEGARRKGGRFNPVGTPALYLALTLDGMFLEMGHGFGHRFEPLTVCCYTVDCDDIIDLRSESGRAAAAIALPEMACDWAYDRATGRTPASWALATRLIAGGAAGILVPSFARGATRAAGPAAHNLVLWRWGPDRPHAVEVHDPSGRLPRDQLSWPQAER